MIPRKRKSHFSVNREAKDRARKFLVAVETAVSMLSGYSSDMARRRPESDYQGSIAQIDSAADRLSSAAFLVAGLLRDQRYRLSFCGRCRCRLRAKKGKPKRQFKTEAILRAMRKQAKEAPIC